MLETVFSRQGRYIRYAALLAAGLLVYLLGGFVFVKWVFEGELVRPSPWLLFGLAVGAVLFALMHIRSMQRLDSVSPKAPPEA